MSNYFSDIHTKKKEKVIIVFLVYHDYLQRYEFRTYTVKSFEYSKNITLTDGL